MPCATWKKKFLKNFKMAGQYLNQKCADWEVKNAPWLLDKIWKIPALVRRGVSSLNWDFILFLTTYLGCDCLDRSYLWRQIARKVKNLITQCTLLRGYIKCKVTLWFGFLIPTYVVLSIKRAIFQTFWWLRCCPDFLFIELDTSNFGYLLIF